MKSTTFILGSLMASVAVAQPHHHQHKHKRNDNVIWVTDYDYVTETVGITTTIWVSSGFVPPTESTASSSFSASYVPGQFFEPQGKGSSTQVLPEPETSSTSPVYVAPTPSSTYVAPTSAPAPAYVAPAKSSSPSSSSPPAPVYVPETPSSVFTPPAATPSTPAPVASVAPSSSSDSTGGGACSSGSQCSGDITYYTAGLGACGITSDGDAENVVALPHGLMGTQSNGNPYCGKTITITCTSTGKTTTAKVVDKCMGCVGDSIDLSNKAFLELADMSVGRTQATWYFN